MKRVSMRALGGLVLALCSFVAALAGANPQPGLPPAPPGMDRSTPQRAVELFERATREGRFDEAAYVLDLRASPPAAHADRGPELARELRYVLDRKLALQPSRISDEPGGSPDDGLLVEKLGSVPLASSTVPITLQRVPLANGEAVWVFSRSTVAAVPELYGAHGPGVLGEMLPAWWHRTSVFDLALWQWLALTAGAVVAALLAVLFAKLLLRFARRIAMRTSNQFDDAVVDHVRGPLRLLIWLSLTSAWVDALRLALEAAAVMSSIIATLLIVAVTWLVIRVLYAISEVVIGRMTVGDGVDEDVVRFGQRKRIEGLRLALNGVVVFMGAALVLTQFEVVRKIGVSLLASAGVLGVVLGFAAQKSVANLIAGLQIASAQPIRIGDRVRVADDFGHVEEITLTYVAIKTWDRRRRIFPITYFIENQFENFSKTAEDKIIAVVVHADYRVPVDAVRAELEQIVRDTLEWNGDVVRLVVIDTTPTTVVLRATASADDFGQAFDLGCIIREKLIEYLRQLEDGRFLPRTRIDMPVPAGLARD